jgi:hypothetical protein
MTPEHAHNLSSYYSFSTHNTIVTSFLLNSSFNHHHLRYFIGIFSGDLCVCVASSSLPFKDLIILLLCDFVLYPGGCTNLAYAFLMCSTEIVQVAVLKVC